MIRFRDKIALAAARAVSRLAVGVAAAIQATPPPVFVHGPRFALGLAVAVGCQLTLSHVLGVGANPFENMREAAAIMAARKGGAP